MWRKKYNINMYQYIDISILMNEQLQKYIKNDDYNLSFEMILRVWSLKTQQADDHDLDEITIYVWSQGCANGLLRHNLNIFATYLSNNAVQGYFL